MNRRGPRSLAPATLLAGRDRLGDQLDQGFGAELPELLAVDEERWGLSDDQRSGVGQVLLEDGSDLRGIHVAPDRLDVDAGLG